MSNDTIGQMSRVFDEAIRIASQKNQDYADAWREQGWRGNLARILSKSARLKNMLWRRDSSFLNGGQETVRETALDQINTLAFFIINLDDGREWGHENEAIRPMTEKELQAYQRNEVAGGTIDVGQYQEFADGNGIGQPTQEWDGGEIPIPGEDNKPRPRKRKVADQPQA